MILGALVENAESYFTGWYPYKVEVVINPVRELFAVLEGHG
jgi:hypothetical protein